MLADQRSPIDIILLVAFPQSPAVVSHPVRGCLDVHLEVSGKRANRDVVAFPYRPQDAKRLITADAMPEALMRRLEVVRHHYRVGMAGARLLRADRAR